MHPEQPGFALRRRRADSPPRGTPSTGLLRGLIQSARPPSFCFLLPRVHAADVAAAQPAQMPSSSSSSSSSSTSTSPAPIPSPVLPSNIGKPEFPDTGWDRVKDLFDRDATQRYPEEVTNVIKSGAFAALAGLFYGGLPAARDARQRYIQVSQAEMYTSRVEAVVSGAQPIMQPSEVLFDMDGDGAGEWPLSSPYSTPSAPGCLCTETSLQSAIMLQLEDSHRCFDHEHAVDRWRNSQREEEERALGTV